MEQEQQKDYNGFHSIENCAHLLGLPITWLKTEVVAGRLPGLQACGRWFLDVDAVKAAVVEKMVGESIDRKGKA